MFSYFIVKYCKTSSWFFLNECLKRSRSSCRRRLTTDFRQEESFLLFLSRGFYFPRLSFIKIVSATWKNEEFGIIINYTVLPYNTNNIFRFFSQLCEVFDLKTKIDLLFFFFKIQNKTKLSLRIEILLNGACVHCAHRDPKLYSDCSWIFFGKSLYAKLLLCQPSASMIITHC